MTDTPTFHTLIPLFKELRGERVVVRPYRESDAQALYEAVAESRDHLRPWMPFADEHQKLNESRQSLSRRHRTLPPQLGDRLLRNWLLDTRLC